MNKRSDLQRLLTRLENWWYDIVNRSDTSGVVSQADISGDSPNLKSANSYMAARTRNVKRVLKATAQFIGDPKDYTFVDFGCGKGKVCLMASRFGFGNVIGCDIDPHLIEIANTNRNLLPKSIQDNLVFTCEDAANFNFSKYQRLVMFFFNPFDARVFSQVLNKAKSDAGEFNDYTIIYINPEHANTVKSYGYKQVWQGKDKGLIIYRLT